MATMKQRRATKAQWSASDPVLAAGEIGFEQGESGQPDKFKIGNGLSNWNQLKYFLNEDGLASMPLSPLTVATINAAVSNLVNGAPDALDTLSELAQAITDSNLEQDAGRLSKATLDSTYAPSKVRLKSLWTPYGGSVYPQADILSDDYSNSIDTHYAAPVGFLTAQYNSPYLNTQGQVLQPVNPANAAEGARNNPTTRDSMGGCLDIEFELTSDRVTFMLQCFKDMDTSVYVSDEAGVMRRIRPRPLVFTPNDNSFTFRTIRFNSMRARRIRFVMPNCVFYQVIYPGNAVIARSPDRPLVVSVSDSFRDAAGMKNVNSDGTPSAESYYTSAITDHLQMRMGWAYARLGEASTGWFNNASGISSDDPGPLGSAPFLSDRNVEKIKAFGKNKIRIVEINGTINDGVLSGGREGMKTRVLAGLDKLISWDSGIRFVLWGPEPLNFPTAPNDPTSLTSPHGLNRLGMLDAIAERPRHVIGFVDPSNPANAFWTGLGSERNPSTSSQSLFTGMDDMHYNYAGGEHYAHRGAEEMGEFYIEREREITA